MTTISTGERSTTMDKQEGVVALRGLLSKVYDTARFELIESNVTDISEKFTCELRTNLDIETSTTYSGKCDSWKDRFVREVNCDFVVQEQRAGNRFVFRKIYACHLSSKNKTKKDLHRCKNRNLKCEAKLDMKVLAALSEGRKQRERDRRNGGLLSKGLDTRIKITFNHTHPVYVVEHLRLQRVSEDTKNLFEEYFTDSMSSVEAKAHHENQNLLNAGITETERETALADGSRNPTYSQVQYLYGIWREKHFGDGTVDDIVDALIAKQAAYAEQGITIHIQKDPLVVVILTPIMRRAHEKEFAGEFCFVDSCGSCDQGDSVLTFMFAVHKVGGIPLAFIFHQDQTEENYTAAFKALRESVGPRGFGGKGQPCTFMTDDILAERRGLKTAFPSSVLLFGIFHVCQAVWRWLCETKHGVGQERMTELMLIFRRVLYAPTQALCDEAAQEMYKNDLYKSNGYLKQYFDDIFNRQSDWCLFQRRSGVTHGHSSNNIMAASFRIFKDYILERCKTLNAASLVDFVVDQLENYHYKRLMSFVNMQNTKPEMQNYRSFLKKCSDLEVRQESEFVYKAFSGTITGKEYEVDIEKEICDCPEGIEGKFCFHLCAVHMKTEVDLKNIPKLRDGDKADILYIASGSLNNLQFYRSMWVQEDHRQSPEAVGEDNSTPSDSELELDDGQLSAQVSPSLNSSREEVNQRFLALHDELRRIEEICETSSPENLLLSLRSLQSAYSKVKTVAQFHTMCRAQSNDARGTVHPTSGSRREKRADLTSGAKRIQAERPSKFKALLRKTKKRPRDLSRSTARNVPKTRLHTPGMQNTH